MNAVMHTPGPWAVHTPKPGHYADNAYSVIAPRKTNEETVLVCELNTTVRNPWRPPVDTLADAQLIASAPELLAALVGLLEARENQMLTRVEWESAEKAIAKACGK